jgi:hypothetical protein
MPNDDEMGNIQGLQLWDGSAYTGDGGYFGGFPVSFIENRVISFGSIDRTLATQLDDLPSSLSQVAISAYSVSLDNTDRFFSNLLADYKKEPLLAQKLIILQGFKGDAYEDFVKLFEGIITKIALFPNKCRITAEAITAVFPSEAGDEGLTVYALEGDGATEMAEQSFTVAEMSSSFFSSDSWLFTCNFQKDALSDAGAIFEIENSGYYSGLVLQIGIDANDYLYVTTGQDVEGSYSSTTYTDTVALTSKDIAKEINIRIYWNSVDDEITFTINGTSRTQSATEDYDRTMTLDNTIRVGNGFDGDIQNIIWNNTNYWVNNQGDNTLTDFEDILQGLNLPRTDGTWAVWPQ